MKALIPKKIEEYCLRHTHPRGKLLRELEKYTQRYCDNSQMLIGPHEGALLTLLVRLTGARRVLEIGTFTGYSALCMAEALPKNGRLHYLRDQTGACRDRPVIFQAQPARAQDRTAPRPSAGNASEPAGLRRDPRVECVMLPLRDGVSLIRKR